MLYFFKTVPISPGAKCLFFKDVLHPFVRNYFYIEKKLYYI